MYGFLCSLEQSIKEMKRMERRVWQFGFEKKTDETWKGNEEQIHGGDGGAENDGVSGFLSTFMSPWISTGLD